MSTLESVVLPSSPPSVGVVVPCYNYARYLSHNLNALLRQSDVDLDVVVVDDASSDSSHQVARAFADRDGRVRVICHARNRGHIASYNEGLELVRGDFVVLVSADDVLTPGSLARSARALAAHPSAGLAYGSAIQLHGDGEPEVHPIGARHRAALIHGEAWLARRCRRMTNTIFSPEAMLRRSVYEQIGPYDARLPHTGDFALWLAASALSDVIQISAPAAFYRTHDSNMHDHTEQLHDARTHAMVFDLEQRKTTVEITFANPALPASVLRFRETALRRLAEEAFELACRAYTWGFVDTWPVDEIIAFGLSCRPDPRRSPAWQRYSIRRRAGVTRARRHPVFMIEEKLFDLGQGARRTIDRVVGA